MAESQTFYLAEMTIGSYILTALGETEEQALRALQDEYETKQLWTRCQGMEWAEWKYFCGVTALPMQLGKVAWT